MQINSKIYSLLGFQSPNNPDKIGKTRLLPFAGEKYVKQLDFVTNCVTEKKSQSLQEKSGVRHPTINLVAVGRRLRDDKFNYNHWQFGRSVLALESTEKNMSSSKPLRSNNDDPIIRETADGNSAMIKSGTSSPDGSSPKPSPLQVTLGSKDVIK